MDGRRAQSIKAVGIVGVVGHSVTQRTQEIGIRMALGARPLDPEVLAAVAGLLAMVALLASYVPARRAARIDPLSALRCDGALIG